MVREVNSAYKALNDGQNVNVMRHIGISFTSMLPLGYLHLTRIAGKNLQLMCI